MNNPFGYNDTVWALFNHPQYAGRFAEGAAGVVGGRASTRAARSVLQLWFRIERGRVGEARFQAYGCPTSIAVGAWIAQHSLGRGVGGLRAFDAATLRTALEIPEERIHCAWLGEDAIKAALAALPETAGDRS